MDPSPNIVPAVPDRKEPVACPVCGGRDLKYNLAEWFAHSLDPQDLHNTAVLSETQCMDCALAFWT